MYWIKLICRNCNQIDDLILDSLIDYMDKVKERGRKEGDLYRCPYGCLDKSDMHIYSIKKDIK